MCRRSIKNFPEERGGQLPPSYSTVPQHSAPLRLVGAVFPAFPFPPDGSPDSTTAIVHLGVFSAKAYWLITRIIWQTGLQVRSGSLTIASKYSLKRYSWPVVILAIEERIHNTCRIFFGSTMIRSFTDKTVQLQFFITWVNHIVDGEPVGVFLVRMEHGNEVLTAARTHDCRHYNFAREIRRDNVLQYYLLSQRNEIDFTVEVSNS